MAFYAGHMLLHGPSRHGATRRNPQAHSTKSLVGNLLAVEQLGCHPLGLELGARRAAQPSSNPLALLLAEEDVGAIGAALEPGSYAAVLVWENVWAAPFAASVRRSGGQLVASGRIPIRALVAALEADEAAMEGA